MGNLSLRRVDGVSRLPMEHGCLKATYFEGYLTRKTSSKLLVFNRIMSTFTQISDENGIFF